MIDRGKDIFAENHSVGRGKRNQAEKQSKK